MFFGVLGPMVVVADDGVETKVGAPMQRGILAILLSRANRVVSRDELVDALWDGQDPATARTTVAAHMARLRRTLGPGPGARIQTRPPGYLIEVAGAEVDALRLVEVEKQARSAERRGAWAEMAELVAGGLALWRGRPYQDVPVGVLHRESAPALEAARVQLVEAGVTADLRLGRVSTAVDTLQQLISDYPLREHAYQQLIGALAEQGRRAEALEVYQRARTVLDEQLGLDPGPGLARAHEAVLRSPAPPARPAAPPTVPDAGKARRPHQLPAAPRHFSGRVAQLQGMTDDARSRRSPIFTVVGPGGIGKTALALTWAHQAKDDFPDGQLYVNLRGFAPGGHPVPPDEAMTGFLNALGVPASRIPETVSGQTAYFRTLVADKRLLVVLDNAASAEQVRALLPGGPGCLAIVTSRDRLTGLVAAEGAQPFPLDYLGPEEALELLEHRLGGERVEREEAVIRDLIAACGGLPLALAVVAARLALEPGLATARLVERLRDERAGLAELDIDDALTDVRSVFSWSYLRLSPGAATMFRVLGLHAGPTVSVAAAAGAAGVAQREAEAALRELAGAHLLTAAAQNRFAMHDLIRLYATELAGSEFDVAQAAAVRHRIADHYLHGAVAADRLINPSRAPIELDAPDPGSGPATFADAADAAAWLSREYDVLKAVAVDAAEHGLDRHAWQLPWALVVFLERRGDWQPMVSLPAQAVAAIRRLGSEPRTLARALSDAAQSGSRAGRTDLALANLAEARDLWRGLGDLAGQARVERIAALIYEGLGRFPEMVEHAGRALELARATGNSLDEARACTTLAWAQVRTGDYQRALEIARDGLVLNRRVGYVMGQAYLMDTMALAFYRLGELDEALVHYRQTLAIYESAEDGYQQALTLTRLAAVAEAHGDLTDAGLRRDEAAVIVEKLGLDAEEVTGEALAVMAETGTAARR